MLENLVLRLQLLQTVVNNPETAKRISAAAAFRVIADLKRRIFNNGLATDGSTIGQYSTTPFYQNPNNLVGVPKSAVKPQGKNGLATFKNGNQKKTRYLASGYKELRDLTGRQSEYVDLSFSGSMAQNIQVGFSGELAVVRFTDAAEAEKMAQNEEHFGKEIIQPSQDEIENGEKAARFELFAILEENDF